ncbi:MAG: NAD(P)/FAD-dependent oxidoreductase [Candidatus Omnitrophota bacterium]|nr:NAD(P)/FAD-dependent oxidoreductase [Candidatus Omnitrophota bacterium]
MITTVRVYDVAIIGAGAAGMLAAIRAAQCGARVILVERNNAAGRKLLITGGGRCNLTNTASLDIFINKFKPTGEFLRSAFFSLSNEDLMNFIRTQGLELTVEERGRVIPATNDSASVVRVLEHSLKNTGVTCVFRARVNDIKRHDGSFLLYIGQELRIRAARVIIATGGASYKATGSSGDGARLAKRLKHTVIPFGPGLVPLVVKEHWARELQGITLRSVRVLFSCTHKKISSDIGELLFTHFGISGPLALDSSAAVVAMLAECKEVTGSIDVLPAMSREKCEQQLGHQCRTQSSRQIKSILQDFLPKRMVAPFLIIAGIHAEKKANQITKAECRVIVEKLKGLTVIITGSRPLDEAMVTCGGVSIKDIDPRTMESRIMPGLYFAGEVIEGRAPSGGYNLQQAFSTGFLAGQSAARSVQ